MSDNPIYHQALKNLGFEEVEYISSGQFGAVYKGLWTEHDGVEHDDRDVFFKKVQPA